MKYFVVLKDSIIITDDYGKSEKDLLKKNIKGDLKRLDIHYPVPVYDSAFRNILTVYPG